MALLQRQSQTLRQQQKADPQLLLTNRLLQMARLELRQHLHQELSENPALEPLEEPACPRCGVPTRGGECPACRAGVERVREWDPEAYYAGDASGTEDPFSRLESMPTLHEHLTEQFLLVSPEPLKRPGCYLIANIDESGYLRCTVEEAVETVGAPQDDVESALALIQACEPAGLGARSLQECLLIQARARRGEPGTPAHLETLLGAGWKELVAARWAPLARQLRLPQEEVVRIADWIRTHLCPYPGYAFRPMPGHAPGRRSTIEPDLILSRNADGMIVVRLVHEETPLYRVNPEYARLWRAMRERPGDYTLVERRQVREHLIRARMFVRSLEERVGVLRRIGECLLVEQEPFLRTELDEDMRPLTQAQVAAFLHLHESTLSRAVADKFVQLPSGRVVPLATFFDRSLCYRRLVANLVAEEDPGHPLSDQEISDLLRRQGVEIARRTVMKYREEMNILSSRQRSRTGKPARQVPVEQ